MQSSDLNRYDEADKDTGFRSLLVIVPFICLAMSVVGIVSVVLAVVSSFEKK